MCGRCLLEIDKKILSGCISQEIGKQAIPYLMRTITPEMLEEKYQPLYKMCVTLFSSTNGLMNVEILESILESRSDLEEEKRVNLTSTFTECSYMATELSEVKFFADQVVERYTDQGVSNLMVEALEIKGGKKVKNGKEFIGPRGAVEYILEGAADLLSDSSNSAPEGKASIFMDEMSKAYDEAKNEELNGVPTGFKQLDSHIGGVLYGELALYTAYAGEGKSFAMINSMYSAAFEHGKNCVYVTVEMPYRQVLRRLISRHSVCGMFSCGTRGIPTNDIKKGTLPEDLEKVLKNEVIPDIKTGVGKRYGIPYIMQVPYSATPEYIRARLMSLEKNFSIDAVYIDYLQLLTADRSYGSTREEMGDIVKGCKRMAMSLMDGRGVAVISGYQTNRVSWNKAKEDKKYDRDAFSETAEAERSADLGFWLLKEPGVENELLAGAMKVRDATPPPVFQLTSRFEVGYLGDDGVDIGDVEDDGWSLDI